MICPHCNKYKVHIPKWANEKFPKLCQECYLYWWLPLQIESRRTKRASDGLKSPAKKQSSTAGSKSPAKKRKVTSRA